jgi:hypothetical protein
MDQQWHNVFYSSMRQSWLYFCYWFDGSVKNSLMLSIPCGSCDSVFIDDFKVYSYSVFTSDLWISHDIAFLTIPCVSHYSIFAIKSMHLSWIQWRCRFHTASVTYSVMISRSTVTLFSQQIYGLAVTLCFWQFHASSIALFLRSIWCVCLEFIDVVDYIRQLSLNTHWRFWLVLKSAFLSWFYIIILDLKYQ